MDQDKIIIMIILCAHTIISSRNVIDYCKKQNIIIIRIAHSNKKSYFLIKLRSNKFVLHYTTLTILNFFVVSASVEGVTTGNGAIKDELFLQKEFIFLIVFLSILSLTTSLTSAKLLRSCGLSSVEMKYLPPSLISFLKWCLKILLVSELRLEALAVNVTKAHRHMKLDSSWPIFDAFDNVYVPHATDLWISNQTRVVDFLES